MLTAAIIQARLGSTRLPGKVLADLSGQPVLAHVVQRAQAIRGVRAVVLALPAAERAQWAVEGYDDHEWFHAVDVYWHEGPVDDVLGRYVGAARGVGAEWIVRITADCPLYAPDLAERGLEALARGNYSYFGDLTWPGMDVEVFTRAQLEEAERFYWLAGPGREHAGVPYMRTRQTAVVLHEMLILPWLALDIPADLDRIRRVHAALTDPTDYTMRATLAACRAAGV